MLKSAIRYSNHTPTYFWIWTHTYNKLVCLNNNILWFRCSYQMNILRVHSNPFVRLYSKPVEIILACISDLNCFWDTSTVAALRLLKPGIILIFSNSVFNCKHRVLLFRCHLLPFWHWNALSSKAVLIWWLSLSFPMLLIAPQSVLNCFEDTGGLIECTMYLTKVFGRIPNRNWVGTVT